MAHNQHPFAHRQPAQAIALVGVLSLACWPVAVSAQMMGPGIGRTMNRPLAMNRSMPSSSMLSHPGGMLGGIGSAGGAPAFERPLYGRPTLPRYGGILYHHDNFNPNGMGYNSISQGMPGNPNEYGSRYVPYQAPNPTMQGQSRAMIGQYGGGQYGGRLQRSYPVYRGNPGYNVYNNSVWHPRGLRRYSSWGATYFPGGYGYYPYYSPNYAYGLSCASPYYYYGTFPPYIGLDDVYQDPPQYDFVPNPTYSQDGQYQGNRPDDVQSYYLNGQADNGALQKSAPGQYRVGEDMVKKDALLNAAVSDITAAWKNGDIQSLSKHIRPNARVAVYLRGKYQYSLDGSDYLDMTRDALRATKTVSFTLDDVKRQENGVTTANGRHIYQDKEGKNHTVLVSYVLEKTDNEYYITQIGTAPVKLTE